MTNREQLLERIATLPENTIVSLLDMVLEKQCESSVAACPYCSSKCIIRFGHRCGKQRFRCKDCGRTFVTTTHTVMYYSHFSAEIWRSVLEDTLRGCSIDHTAARLGLYHQAVFDMRHKVLLALQELPGISDVELNGVVELDETFVLDSYKGIKLDASVGRTARKHGAVAQTPGISNEYICINTGVERQGSAYAVTVNRAKPSTKELQAVYAGHIANGTLILCDGLKSYHGLSQVAECSVRDCTELPKEDRSFFHLNTVNSFHSFLKERYRHYRGVATKYLKGMIFKVCLRDSA